MRSRLMRFGSRSRYRGVGLGCYRRFWDRNLLEGQSASVQPQFDGSVEQCPHGYAEARFWQGAVVSGDLVPMVLVPKGEVVAHGPALLPAEDGRQVLSRRKGAMRIDGICGRDGESSVEALHEPSLEEVVGRGDGGDSLKRQFLEEPVLENAVLALHPSLGLGGVCGEDRDPQLLAGYPEGGQGGFPRQVFRKRGLPKGLVDGMTVRV